MESTPPRWTIGELARRAATALANGYAGPPSGRVRGIPDVRSIRWYATIGLLDKPAAYRGRTALYGPRHLRQLVAVKRRQAAGVELAGIQAELAGVSDARLAEIAQLPDEQLSTPIPATRDDAADRAAGTESDPPSNRGSATADLAFWKNRPASVRLADEPSTSTPPADSTLSYGIEIVPGVSVLITAARPPTPADIAAVQHAARPLVQVVQHRELAAAPPASSRKLIEGA